MKNNTIKNTVLVVLFIILAPLILVGVTTVGNSLSGKSKDKVVQTTEQQTAKVPEETKAESNNIPKASNSKVTEGTTSKKESTNNNNNDTNTEKSESSGVVSTTPVAGQDYVIKSGDSLFVIASKAYGEANAQNGVEKIKEANKISNNNITAGQKIQIPKI